MKLYKKYKLYYLGMFCLLILTGCSSDSGKSWFNDKVYYSSELKVVCFHGQDSISCLPSNKVDVNNIKPDTWTIM